MHKFLLLFFYFISIPCFCFDKYSLQRKYQEKSVEVSFSKKFLLDLNFDTQDNFIYYKHSSSHFWISLVIGNKRLKVLKVPFRHFNNKILKVSNFKISKNISCLIIFFEGKKSFAGTKSTYRKPLIITFKHSEITKISYHWGPISEFKSQDWMRNSGGVNTKVTIKSNEDGKNTYLLFKADSMNISLYLNKEKLKWSPI